MPNGYVIEKNVPIPNGYSFTQLLRDMEPGDSVLADKRNQACMWTMCKRGNIKGKFVTRAEGDKIRIWRVS
jgi:hypothetical protein